MPKKLQRQLVGRIQAESTFLRLWVQRNLNFGNLKKAHNQAGRAVKPAHRPRRWANINMKKDNTLGILVCGLLLLATGASFFIDYQRQGYIAIRGVVSSGASA